MECSIKIAATAVCVNENVLLAVNMKPLVCLGSVTIGELRSIVRQQTLPDVPDDVLAMHKLWMGTRTEVHPLTDGCQRDYDGNCPLNENDTVNDVIAAHLCGLSPDSAYYNCTYNFLDVWLCQ